MKDLVLAVVAFVASHELLSHPLRRPLVARLGERGFLGLYSVVALATLIWAVAEFRMAPDIWLWAAPNWAWDVGRVLMLIAMILFVGSLVSPNPALPMAGAAAAKEPRGVLRITRHPMMWSFAIWALVHIVLAGRLPTLIFGAGIGVLALFGAHMQDVKKRRQLGESWSAYESRTSYWPLGAQVAGRQPWRTIWPGAVALISGITLFLLLAWAHPLLFGPVVFDFRG